MDTFKSQNLLLTLLAVLVCACLTVALPASRVSASGSASQAAETANADFARFIKLLGRMKALGQQAGETGQWTGDDAMAKRDPEPTKRYWNYDYGLGGGRFGKRFYGDYGIGGGR